MMTKEGVIFMVKDIGMRKNRFLPSVESFVKSLAEGHCHGYSHATGQVLPYKVETFFDGFELAAGSWTGPEQARLRRAVKAVLSLPIPSSALAVVDEPFRAAWIKKYLADPWADLYPTVPKEGKVEYRKRVRLILQSALP